MGILLGPMEQECPCVIVAQARQGWARRVSRVKHRVLSGNAAHAAHQPMVGRCSLSLCLCHSLCGSPNDSFQFPVTCRAAQSALQASK